jgi:hypothetical protein
MICECGHGQELHGESDCSIPEHSHYRQFCIGNNRECSCTGFTKQAPTASSTEASK